MATRFYFGGLSGASSAAPPVSPAYDASWDSSQAGRRILYRKTTITALASLSNLGDTVTTGVTSNILSLQYTSDPIPPQRIVGTFSFVSLCSEANALNNSTLAVLAKVVSQDGTVVRGTLFSVFGTDTEFPLTASQATRIVNAQAITALTTLPGDRIVIEVGMTNTAPTSSGTSAIAIGFNAASDYALTSGLTTSLNPWCELSQDIWDADLNNYQFVKAGDGISVSEKIQ